MQGFSVKKLFKKAVNHFFPIVFILLCVVITYWKLADTFFQQDEWMTFGGIFYYLSKGVPGIISSFFPANPISHFNPLAVIFAWIEYPLFYTNFSPYAWVSIILHSMNAMLVYVFAYSLFKNRKISLISGLIFATYTVSDQSVTWVATTNSYEVPTFFILISLLFYFRYIRQENPHVKNLVVSLLTLFISLLFHEIGLFLILFYPAFFLFCKKSYKNKPFKYLILGLSVLVFMFLFIRIPFLFGISSPLPVVTDISSPPVAVYPYRTMSIIMKSFTQTFFSQGNLISISDNLVRLAYPQFVGSDNAVNPYVSQTIVLDLVCYLISIFIVMIALFLKRKFSKNRVSDDLTQAFIFSLLFIPASLLTYAFVPGHAGYASLFEPRFLYSASIGSSLLMAIIFYFFLLHFSKSKIKQFLVYFVLLVYLVSNIHVVRSDVERLIGLGKPIKYFLATITESYPRLYQRTVFYVQSDTAYYGMLASQTNLPVEIGFGRMLLVWYQSKEKFPGCFYENGFLLSLLEEGYQECGGRGFGYFRDYDKLVEAVTKNNISASDVISYSWSGKTGEFTNTTQKVKDNLEKELVKKKLSR